MTTTDMQVLLDELIQAVPIDLPVLDEIVRLLEGEDDDPRDNPHYVG